MSVEADHKNKLIFALMLKTVFRLPSAGLFSSGAAPGYFNVESHGRNFFSSLCTLLSSHRQNIESEFEATAERIEALEQAVSEAKRGAEESEQRVEEVMFIDYYDY